MGNHMKRKNIIFGVLLITGLIGSVFESFEYLKIQNINRTLKNGDLITDEAYAYQKKFAAAYDQGEHQDYKHAIQTYGQLLETSPSVAEQAKIQFNIANNLFLSGLIRRVNDDGSVKDEAKYAFSQAMLAYEQSLRLDPSSRRIKFNLSILHSIMPANTKNAPKEQSGMELSNLPIGLP